MTTKRLLTLHYSPECSLYYGTNIPKLSNLSSPDFELILYELNKNKLSGLASIPAINWFIYSLPYLGVSIYGWKRLDLFVVLAFLMHVSATTSRMKYQESIIITCSRLNTVLASKGVSVAFNRETKQVAVLCFEVPDQEPSDWAQVPKDDAN
ncbi:hypothetical protein HDV04_000795 [Boothiomyces sp. JEL0838]|nr:hypothetical protein HDV04_000795 [Boothiomyces sp. JEL0838]